MGLQEKSSPWRSHATGRRHSGDAREVELGRREEAWVELQQELHLPDSLQDPS